MLPFVKNDRCKRCQTERALRQCPRTKKKLCWKCCNEIRVDLKCPETCPYSPLLSEIVAFPVFKADTVKEDMDVIKRFIDLWIVKENELFDHTSPINYSAKHKDKMLKWLSGFQYPGHFPIAYLMQKLKLSFEDDIPFSNPENVAEEYLNHIISLDYSELNHLTANTSPINGLAERYAELIAKIPSLKKVKRYSFIHTGVTDDGGQAIVYLELNWKDDFTFMMRNDGDKWVIRQMINGNPGMYYKQNDLYKAIAQYLGNRELETAFNEIAEALRSYPDSPDLYYYRGLYWIMMKQFDKAKVDLFSSIALDNSFASPYLNLGLMYLNDKDFSEAKLWFASLVLLQPDNPDAINNLAVAHYGLNEKDAAIALWTQILKTFPTYEHAKNNLELFG